MCGFAALIGGLHSSTDDVKTMIDSLRHRGPDGINSFLSPSGLLALGHSRLAIIDRMSRSNQPMTDPSGRYTLVFNGEIYNYKELRAELSPKFRFATESDSEVALAALITWGTGALSRFVGMFSLLFWDEKNRELVGARDRFGVKPLFYSELAKGTIAIASEIKALHAISPLIDFDRTTWAGYLSGHVYDSNVRTFWEGVSRLPAGYFLRWTPAKGLTTTRWYRMQIESNLSLLPDDDAREVATDLLNSSVALRMRSDVPIGVCLSGGLDSSLVAATAASLRASDDDCRYAFTFGFDHPDYDERAFASQVSREFGYEMIPCLLDSGEVPDLAEAMQSAQDEPFGGIPTLGMGRVFESARDHGVPVLLDGNGLDEGFGGYDYYASSHQLDRRFAPVQSSAGDTRFLKLLVDDLSTPDEGQAVEPSTSLEDAQLHDLFEAKIPRSMRFADRASMMYSCELREPFLDHRLIEFGVSQPRHRKIGPLGGKQMIREIAEQILPREIALAGKRPVQTPQREWLRSELADWTHDCFDLVEHRFGGNLLDPQPLQKLLVDYQTRGNTSSYQIWTIISLALCSQLRDTRRLSARRRGQS